MPDFVRTLPHPYAGPYDDALAALVGDGRVALAQIDTGLAPHPGIGWADGDPPANIRVDLGLNVFDPKPGNDRPVTDLSRGKGRIDRAVDYPDHGVKTLSALIGCDPERLRGVVPGATVVPYRVANGPVFRGDAGTELIGKALEHALKAPAPVRVVTISMGNPGAAGAFEPVRSLLGGAPGMKKETGRAIDKAYEAGVIVCCAAGQIINTVVYPARYARTIAVGGYDMLGGEPDHYPPAGYQEPTRVDVWAQAMRVNRAGFDLTRDLAPTWAENDDDASEPSGTSYATPQVAGAAALWVERWHDELEARFGETRWKIVESFRKALRASAVRRMARLKPGRQRLGIRGLDIPALLVIAPPAVSDRDKAGEAAKAGWW